MNLTNDKDSFSVFDPSLEQFFDMAEELDREGARTILNELSTDRQRYRIINKIAEGGSKTIIKVKDSATNRHVAMAILKDNESELVVEEFLREARLTAFLQHPNIMPVYDIGVNSTNQPYFTMELVKEGSNLSSLAKFADRDSKYKTLSARLELFLKICDGIAFAHAKGIIHLDLKPDNIQLDDFGQVLICDWGLARFIKGFDTETISGTDKVHSMDFLNITLRGVIQGTPGFMAPEQATSEKSVKHEQTDIYALGAVLYYLLCFHSPIQRGTVKQMLADTVSGNVIPLSKWQKKLQLPEALIKVCKKAMNINPDKRYNSVTEMQHDIRSYMDGYATTAEDAGFFTQLSLFYHRNKTVSNLIISSLLIILCGGLFFINRLSTSETRAIKSEKEAVKRLVELKKERQEKRQISLIASMQSREAAIKNYYRHDYINGYKQLRESLKLNPENRLTWYNLGWLSITAQQFDDAEIYFSEAMKAGVTENIKVDIQRLKSVIKELRSMINEETGKLDLEDIIEFKLRNKHSTRTLCKHLLYRHKKGFLENF